MEPEPNECKSCFTVIEDGQEYHECTNPKNLDKNPHKLCKKCYEELLKGYDYEDELLDARTLAPTPKQNADGSIMLDAFDRPILMNDKELIQFYKMQKHVKHDEGCPWKDGKLVKKIMGQPVNLRVTDGAAAAAVFASGGDDYDDDLRKAMEISLSDVQPAVKGAVAMRRPSSGRPSWGQGAAAAVEGDDYDDDLRQAMENSLSDVQPAVKGAVAMRRPSSGQGAVVMGRPSWGQDAAAAVEEEDPDIVAALLASSGVEHNPIEIIYSTLHDNRIHVSEADVRKEFQDFSRQNPHIPTEEAIRQIINMFKFPRVVRVMNRVRKELTDLAAEPISDDRLRSEVQRILERESNEDAAVGLVVQNLTPNYFAGGRSKKSKMSKSRRGKKSKMTKSRTGKKSKMTTTRRRRN